MSLPKKGLSSQLALERAGMMVCSGEFLKHNNYHGITASWDENFEKFSSRRRENGDRFFSTFAFFFFPAFPTAWFSFCFLFSYFIFFFLATVKKDEVKSVSCSMSNGVNFYISILRMRLFFFLSVKYVLPFFLHL
jgi:hypothetical protein